MSIFSSITEVISTKKCGSMVFPPRGSDSPSGALWYNKGVTSKGASLTGALGKELIMAAASVMRAVVR